MFKQLINDPIGKALTIPGIVVWGLAVLSIPFAPSQVTFGLFASGIGLQALAVIAMSYRGTRKA